MIESGNPISERAVNAKNIVVVQNVDNDLHNSQKYQEF